MPFFSCDGTGLPQHATQDNQKWISAFTEIEFHNSLTGEYQGCARFTVRTFEASSFAE
jgi:hypothetical protein